MSTDNQSDRVAPSRNATLVAASQDYDRERYAWAMTVDPAAVAQFEQRAAEQRHQ